MNDPTYDKGIIKANKIYHTAHIISEFLNDNAPLGWSKYIPIAESLQKYGLLSMTPEQAREVLEPLLEGEYDYCSISRIGRLRITKRPYIRVKYDGCLSSEQLKALAVLMEDKCE